MPVQIKSIIYEFALDMLHLFGSSLSKVIVYGSYARGDFSENSDIDLMILVSTPEDQIRDYTDRVSDCAFDFFMRYGVDLSPVVKNEDHFNYWADTLPFYRNVKNERVLINAYVATDIFPRELGKQLGRLKTVREESDYDDFFVASEADAKKQYEAAKYISNSIKSYLIERGTL